MSSRTKIEWVVRDDGKPGSTLNFAYGCTNNCYYCYAKKLVKRFPVVYPLGFGNPVCDVELMESKIKALDTSKVPQTIFVGSMTDLFTNDFRMQKNHIDIVGKEFRIGHKVAWMFNKQTEERISEGKKPHRYIFLTKGPAKYLPKKLPMLDNFWYGATIESNCSQVARDALSDLLNLQSQGHNTFVSFEPILGWDSNFTETLSKINWLIVGALTEGGHVNFMGVPIVDAIQKLYEINPRLFVKDSILENINQDNLSATNFSRLTRKSVYSKIEEMRYIPWRQI